MSPTTSAYRIPQRARSGDQPHPWIRALDVFGIPFICYALDGRRIHVSRSAHDLASDPVTGTAIGRQADRLAADELSGRTTTLQIGQFALVREQPMAGGEIVLGVHLARPAVSEICVVIVVRPRARQVTAAGGLVPGLSRRESDVARLIATGLATKEIAYRLGISTHTARHHTERVFAKLGVRNRCGVAALLGRSANEAGMPHPATRPTS
jgi:DNA-binding CsgD family transcriptional regulator